MSVEPCHIGIASDILIPSRKRLEISFNVVSPRSTWAFNNGTDANLSLKTTPIPFECPEGILLEQRVRDSYVKKAPVMAQSGLATYKYVSNTLSLTFMSEIVSLAFAVL